MAVTGSGTQADPYIVDTWEDFIDKINTSTSTYVEFPKQLALTTDTEIVEGKLYVDSNGDVVVNPVISELNTYYENSFYLDANDYEPEGWSTYKLCKAQFNGRGAKIKNIYVKTSLPNGIFYCANSSGRAGFTGINFENILIDCVGTYLFNGCNLNNCIFSIGTKGGFYFLGGRAGETKKNAIYIKVYPSTTESIYLNGIVPPHTFCFNRIILDMPNTQNMSLYINSAHDCLIQGEFNNDSGSYLYLQNSKYMVVDCENTYATAGSGLAGICIANLGKVVGVMGGVTGVPEDKMTDVNYLDSIGFPIQL